MEPRRIPRQEHAVILGVLDAAEKNLAALEAGWCGILPRQHTEAPEKGA